jgi:hypothetical protein
MASTAMIYMVIKKKEKRTWEWNTGRPHRK